MDQADGGGRMGVLCDYFRAPDRSTALVLHRHPDGLFTAEISARTDAVDLKGIEPVVMLRVLVGLLSGSSYEEMFMAGSIPTGQLPDLVLVLVVVVVVFLVVFCVVVRV